MRTKILLTAVAALAVGLASSNAQTPVYSANVVGYYNTPLVAGQLTLVANQLSNGTSNDLATLLASLPNKTTVETWNGSGFTPYSKVSGSWSPSDPVISVGQGFFIQTPATAGPLTNTFVGSVLVAPGGSVTNVLTGGVLTMVGSPIPYATDLNDTNNTLNLSTLPNKSTVEVWNGSGYTPSSKISGSWSPDLNISVGQGFFVQPNGSSTWIQTLPAN